jgi:hypothetical protein
VTFGNTTAYPFYAANNSGGYADTGSQIYINYLEPSTTYYYKIVAWGYCISSPDKFYHQTYTGQFSTSAETVSSSSQIYLDGQVLNSTGSPGSGGQLVLAHCSDWLGGWQNQTWGGSGSGDWAMFTHTGSNGAFQLAMGVLSGSNYVNVCDQAGVATVVSILTAGQTVCDFYNQCASSSSWGGIGVWNDTLVVWDRPYIAVDLESNFVTAPIVQIADFSNANGTDGIPDSNITYTTGTSYSTTLYHCWTALFYFSGCSSATTTIGTNDGYGAEGGNLVVTQKLWESGTGLFDAFSRQSIVASEVYYKGYAPPVNEPASWSIQDTLVPGNRSVYPLYQFGGEYDEGIMVYSNRESSGSLTVSSSQTSYQVKGADVTVDIGYDGVAAGTTLATDQWSQVASSTSSNTLSWSLVGDSQTVPVCYVVYGVGGSSSSSSTTADAIGIWGYAPSESDGSYTCPMPT